ncbi:ubiquitin-specific protease doa4 [Physocladia obscura]|uniref:ubiquitinyl hydrolase 1 n=1 Tax=Physocladia obscura TaxID=109957 RepID=A0AAD5T044_9FUNG|nr:ubiquitin-specific protease doa4 [Physocladia obscura]
MTFAPVSMAGLSHKDLPPLKLLKQSRLSKPRYKQSCAVNIASERKRISGKASESWHAPAVHRPPASMPAQAQTKPTGRSAQSNNASPNMEPHTLADLNKLSANAINMVPSQHSVRRWCSSAETLFDKAQEAKLAEDLDQHYILLMRGVSIAVEIIPKHLDFNKNEPCYRELRKRLDACFNELEELKTRINTRHADWFAAHASAVSPPGLQQQQSNGILTPTSAPFRTSLASKEPANNNLSTINYTSKSSGANSNNAIITNTAANAQQAAVDNLIAARLKALQPGSSVASSQISQPRVTVNGGSNSFGANSAKQQSFAATTDNKQFVSNSALPPAQIKPSLSQTSISSLDQQHQRVPSPASINVANTRNTNLGTPMPPQLSRNSSNGSNASSGGTIPLADKKMSASDLHAGLSSLAQSKTSTKVLILDVRPMEDYIQGHLRWPDGGVSSSNGKDLVSGLVHIEPDWIHAGIDTDQIIYSLRGFSTADDPRIMLFDYRAMFDLIVVYDAFSTSVHSSSVLVNLISALYMPDKNGGKKLSQQPVVLDGGFSGWTEYCRKKGGSHIANFIEIGDGRGGGGPQMTSIEQASPLPSNGASPALRNHAPGQYALDQAQFQHQQQQLMYGNQYGQYSQQAQLARYGQQPAVSGSIGVNMYNYDPNKVGGGYLNPTAFDNPFLGMGAGVVPTYPRLTGQTQSPSFSKQSSFSAGPVEYPSLSQFKQQQSPPMIPKKPISVNLQQSQPLQQQFSGLNLTSTPQIQQQLEVNQISNIVPPQSQQPQYVAPPKLQQLPPPTVPTKPTAQPEFRKPPPPIPAKPRLSITSVELTQQSPAYSNPSEFIPISQLGNSIGVVGLKNLGNSCYMNSTLQCLSGTVPLARYFLGGNYRRGINRSNPMGTKGALVEEFSQVIKSMWSGQESIVTPSQLKEKIGEFNEQFKGSEQHDSQEFLSFLLDSVHEDLNIARGAKAKQIDTAGEQDESISDDIRLQMAWNNYRATNWSIIVDLFQGQYKSKLQCLTCNQTSTTFNPFMYLSVPIPDHNSAGVKGGPVYLDECIDKFVEVEILDGEDAWTCSRCKTKRRTRKTMTIAKLPPILLIHLKRFYYQGPFKSKLETYVDFPLASMDLGKYVASSPGRPESLVYDLYAVSNHTGTLTGGHYTATVHNSSKKAWYNFSDTRVGVCDVNQLKSNAAYILYYVRKSTNGESMTSVDWWKT